MERLQEALEGQGVPVATHCMLGCSSPSGLLYERVIMKLCRKCPICLYIMAPIKDPLLQFHRGQH